MLGIDPGLTRLGLGIVSLGKGRELNFEHVEVLQTTPQNELAERLGLLGDSIARVVKNSDIDALAIERVFAGQNLPSVMGVAQITGVVLYIAQKNNVPVTFYTPKEVKNRVTGYGAADKQQVTNMVMKILRLQQAPKPADAADALAIAITHAWALNKSVANKNFAGPQPNERGVTTAQQKWLAAEKAAKKSKKSFSNHGYI